MSTLDDELSKLEAELSGQAGPRTQAQVIGASAESARGDALLVSGRVKSAKPIVLSSIASAPESMTTLADGSHMPILEDMEQARTDPYANPIKQFLAKEAKNSQKLYSQKAFVRRAGGAEWIDQSLGEWVEDDFRLFVGDLGKEVTDEMLAKQFGDYPSFYKAKVIRNNQSHKTMGYGFVGFLDPVDYAKAFREKNGTYCGTRPMKLRRSKWKDRTVEDDSNRKTKRMRPSKAIKKNTDTRLDKKERNHTERHRHSRREEHTHNQSDNQRRNKREWHR